MHAHSDEAAACLGLPGGVRQAGRLFRRVPSCVAARKIFVFYIRTFVRI
ncbi:Uncharacterised protein [Bordetella pertussis]|nr:Uncharacterised protein [Bordetella pertussis]